MLDQAVAGIASTVMVEKPIVRNAMTNQQINQAIQMHEAGIKWELIAAYFKINTNKLRQEVKHYYESSKELC